MSFLFIDKIIELTPKRKAVAIKRVTEADYLYLTADPHKTKKLQLLNCILLEAIGQLNAWIVMQANQFTLRPLAILYGELEFLAHAHVGDQLVIETTLKELDDKTSLFDGVAKINDHVVFRVTDAAGAFLPMEDFSDPAWVKQQFTEISHSKIPASDEATGLSINTYDRINLDYDSILDFQSGKSITAQKTLNPTAPYFKDHFPKKSVLPISLLLQGQIHLAEKFLIDSFATSAQPYKISKINRVKIADFISPADQIVTQLTLIKKEITRAILQTRTERKGKRICVGTFEFSRN